jgi:hypothetical protein
MEWTRYIDAYCERTDQSFWAEPLNAFSNVGFLIVAVVMAVRLSGLNLPLARALTVILVAVGAGSFNFHTYARTWAAVADIVPIVLFILLYLYAVNRHFLRFSPMRAAFLSGFYVPYSIALTFFFEVVPFFQISSFYWPLPILILGYSGLMRRRLPGTAHALALGAGMLTVSIVVRSVDLPLCSTLPSGTHFLWHLLNAAMLGWMIEVYRRHMVATRRAGR